MPAFNIAQMTEADLARVLAYERENFPFPWTEGMFRDCFSAGYSCLVLSMNGSVIGYAIMSLALDEAQLLNINIDSRCYRQGYGKALLNAVMDRACEAGAEKLFLEVRASNKPAIELYTGMGFSCVGRRKAYYRGAAGREDALVLARALT